MKSADSDHSVQKHCGSGKLTIIVNTYMSMPGVLASVLVVDTVEEPGAGEHRLQQWILLSLTLDCNAYFFLEG